MNGEYLLDTNVLIAVFRREPSVLEKLEPPNQVLTPSIAIGELFFGICKSARRAENMTRVEQFISERHILHCDTGTARVYGQVKFALHAKGKPIPGNDLWIAALALQHNLTLVTRDKHFGYVDDLAVEIW